MIRKLIFVFLISQIIYAHHINYYDSSEVTLYQLKNKLSTPYNLIILDSNITYERADEINKNLIYSYAIGYTTFSIASFYYFSKTWWKDNRSKFHFEDDLNYALSVDKIGHFYGTHINAHFISAALESANVPDNYSYLYASIGALTFQTLIEIKDGFGENWGFSKYDALANFAGSSFFLAQYYLPFLNNFQIKWSYFPSSQLIKNKNRNITDDYEGQTYYLSMKINNFLPDNLEKYWPDFLTFAVGYGIRNWDGFGNADKVFSITLDYDLDALPLYGKFWQFIKNTLNYFHLPAPGIKIINNKILFTICY